MFFKHLHMHYISKTDHEKPTTTTNTATQSTTTANSAHLPIQRKAGMPPPKQTKEGAQPPIQTKMKPYEAKQLPIQRKAKYNEHQVKANVSALTGTDVSDAQVHYNSSKPAQLQAEATAQGTQVHLGQGKEQHLGHELTHIAQQKQGRVQPTIQANNGQGINNDPKLEQEADKIGALAMKGDTIQAKKPINNTPGRSNNQPIQRYIKYRSKDQHRHPSEDQYDAMHAHEKDPKPYSEKAKKRYTKQTERFNKRYKKQVEKGKIKKHYKRRKEGWRHPQRKGLFVSNDGRMAVEAKGAASVQAWADKTLVQQSNTILKSKKSHIELQTQTSDLAVGSVPGTDTPNPHKSDFMKIKPVHTAKNGTKRDMTDPKNTEKREFGAYNSSQPEDFSKKLKFRDCGQANALILGCYQENGDLFNRVYKSKDGAITVVTNNPTATIQAYIQKVMQAEFPKKPEYADKAKAYEAYKKLSDSEAQTIDQKYGLNAAARPDLGEGITAVSAEYSTDKTGYNYHFAANVVQSSDAGDYIACEGLADNPEWYFAMYGTNKGESFHEKQKSVVQNPHISTIVDKE
ncbi:hypothetical protein M23134_03836 [Microscilla marina ATCC 23134]|uniref:eCIS core domain-containing protein n=2 Tax=Microscilla marina TaxID=1027 RepID=A1ZPM8_MICM2|nr:hypothetical protein M23134_03836 [Microscilla marina ATCC 23134]